MIRHAAKLLATVTAAKDNKPVVKLVVLPHQKHQRQLGTAKGKIVMADDFDEPLDDFAPYIMSLSQNS